MKIDFVELFRIVILEEYIFGTDHWITTDELVLDLKEQGYLK